MERDLLENIFVTAIEGGSNYWFKLSRKTNEEIRKIVPKKKEAAYSCAVFSAVYDHGYKAEVIDADNEEVIGTLDVTTFDERLKLLENSPAYAWALDNERNDNGDGESSDIVFQFLILKEVIYG